MPVNIYRVTPEHIKENEHIAWLCDDEWLLWPQIDSLSVWLKQSTSSLLPADYVADVGFCWRRNARAGGPILDPVAMRRMADLGMSLYLSEYGSFADDLADSSEKGSRE